MTYIWKTYICHTSVPASLLLGLCVWIAGSWSHSWGSGPMAPALPAGWWWSCDDSGRLW